MRKNRSLKLKYTFEIKPSYSNLTKRVIDNNI